MYGILDKTTNIRYYGHITVDGAKEAANAFTKIDNGEYLNFEPTDDVDYSDRYEVFEYNEGRQDMSCYILDLQTGKRYEAPRFADPHLFMENLENLDSYIYYKKTENTNHYRNRYRVVYGKKGILL